MSDEEIMMLVVKYLHAPSAKLRLKLMAILEQRLGD